MEKKTEIRPLGDRIVVRREKPPEKSAGGIIFPDTAKAKPLEATVIACGPGALVEGKRIEPSVKAGDRVVIGQYSGIEIVLDGVEHLVVHESDIVGELV
jgi:chaperonin GroES